MSSRTELLTDNLRKLYAHHVDDLLFHGWHHITFVTRKTVEFAAELNVDLELAEATALTHDLNYIVDVKSDVDAGSELRRDHLQKSGFTPLEISEIETAVHSGSTEFRDANISDLAKALSDADSLFKVLPVGPMILSARYITETKVDIKTWADRIIRDQQPLLDENIYFYTATANRKYLEWAKLNLKLVKTIQESLDDPDITAFLDDCKRLGYI
jgi:uncharacterized protein